MVRRSYQRLSPVAIDEIWVRLRAGHAVKPTARALGLPMSTVRAYLLPGKTSCPKHACTQVKWGGGATRCVLNGLANRRPQSRPMQVGRGSSSEAGSLFGGPGCRCSRPPVPCQCSTRKARDRQRPRCQVSASPDSPGQR